ncbi:hypothetical protein ACWD4J_42510 [Streptomyces sp. NPDC002577]
MSEPRDQEEQGDSPDTNPEFGRGLSIGSPHNLEGAFSGPVVGSPPPLLEGDRSRVGGAGEADACPGCGAVYPRMLQRLRGVRGRHESGCRLASVPLRYVAGLDMADALLLLGDGESGPGGESH